MCWLSTFGLLIAAHFSHKKVHYNLVFRVNFPLRNNDSGKKTSTKKKQTNTQTTPCFIDGWIPRIWYILLTFVQSRSLTGTKPERRDRLWPVFLSESVVLNRRSISPWSLPSRWNKLRERGFVEGKDKSLLCLLTIKIDLNASMSFRPGVKHAKHSLNQCSAL